MHELEFERLVQEAILLLPKNIREKMENVAVVVEDSPTALQLKKGRTATGGLLLGLYEGIPKTKRGSGYTLVLPDKITIFQKSIESVSATAEGIKKLVKNAVWHEVAHHFGFDEEQVQKLSQKRKS